MIHQEWIKNKLEKICQNAFRLYGPDTDQDLFKLGSVILSLTRPKQRRGKSHMEYKPLETDSYLKGEFQNIPNDKRAEVAELVLASLNKSTSPDYYGSEVKLAILQYFCGFESFQVNNFGTIFT
jgi:hypothetical protein